jgi:hypothetical protein
MSDGPEPAGIPIFQEYPVDSYRHFFNVTEPLNVTIEPVGRDRSRAPVDIECRRIARYDADHGRF